MDNVQSTETSYSTNTNYAGSVSPVTNLLKLKEMYILYTIWRSLGTYYVKGWILMKFYVQLCQYYRAIGKTTEERGLVFLD